MKFCFIDCYSEQCKYIWRSDTRNNTKISLVSFSLSLSSLSTFEICRQDIRMHWTMDLFEYALLTCIWLNEFFILWCMTNLGYIKVNKQERDEFYFIKHMFQNYVCYLLLFWLFLRNICFRRKRLKIIDTCRFFAF